METETQNEMPDDGRDGKNRDDRGLAAPDTAINSQNRPCGG